MSDRLRVSRLISTELDGVPPRTISLELEGADGARILLEMGEAAAAQLEVALLRIPLQSRWRASEDDLDLAVDGSL